jgi:hypothetical protein
MVNYYFDTFEHLNSFDILPYQEVVDLYLKNQSKLEKSGFEKLGGKTERPINSDTEDVDEKGFWGGYEPRYFNINTINSGVTHGKADVVSMNMKGLNKDWSHFVYLELPYQLFEKYQISVHSNSDITKYKEFLNELDLDEITPSKVRDLVLKYDTKYPEKNTIQDYFGDFENLAWRMDLDEGQYVSIKESGIIYPICYNSMFSILDRGTHRSLFLSHTKSDVPIFIQHPKLNAEKIDFIWEVNLGSHLSDIIMRVDMNNKKLKFFKEVL